MNQRKKTVALIFGGRGHEHSVSLAGAEYLLTLIDTSQYVVVPTLITRDGEWRMQNATHIDTYSTFRSLCDSLTDSGISSAAAPIYSGGRSGFLNEDGTLMPIDVAIPLLHGDGGEDGTVQGALECARIPYVGCGVTASALSLDKAYTKTVAEREGIPTAKWTVVIDGSTHRSLERAITAAEQDFGYPMFVKAAGLGSSVGVYRVDDRNELITAYRDAVSLGARRVLLEEALEVASELECAVLLTARHRIYSDLSEIRCDGGYYTYERKYSGNGVTVTPHAEIPEEVRDAVHRYTEILSDALGVRHLSRFDFFLTTEGRLIFNEVNTLPGFTPTSMYARLIEDAGVPPKELVRELIEDAVCIP
jgi:D-alanine-D-alanine ligase